MTAQAKTDRLLLLIRNRRKMTLRQQFMLTVLLSIPTILMQVSNIAMEYIDASMVGRLGAGSSAAIGVVASSTWLFYGLLGACSAGFSVQVAHLVGAGRESAARQVFRQSVVASSLFSAVLAAIAWTISHSLPHWLGADPSICPEATDYFMVFAIFLPFQQMHYLGAAMLRSCGDMRIPALLNVMMCILDVIFNLFLIFPDVHIGWGTVSLVLPGAGLGVFGASLGTGLAYVVSSILMMSHLCLRSPILRLRGERGRFLPQRDVVMRAKDIGVPMALMAIALSSAQIVSTMIVASLGVVAIAAHSFGIIAESLCYMPAYGFSEAGTTLVGQSHGAGRPELVRRFGHLATLSALGLMVVMGTLLYLCAPLIMRTMTHVPEVITLGVEILRIEAFAEPFFGAAIVGYGVFVGIGKTKVSSIVNFTCMWGIRLTSAAILAPVWGLRGVWIAMAVELSVRGMVFLFLLWKTRWHETKLLPNTSI